MKLFITLVALVALTTGDVSHVTNSYLPPHSVSSQSRTVTFTPGSGYSAAGSGAYPSPGFSAPTISYGSSGYSGKLQVAAAPTQTYNSAATGITSSSYMSAAQRPSVGQSLTSAYSSGSGYSTGGGKHTVQKTYSAPLVQQQTVQSTFSAPVGQKTYTAPIQQSYTASGKTFTAPAVQKVAYSAPSEQQTSSVVELVKESYTSPIVQQTYTAPGKTYNSHQKPFASAPLVEQQTYSTSGKSFNNYQSHTSPGVQSTIVSAPLAQKSYNVPVAAQTFTSKAVKQSYTAPSVERGYLAPIVQQAYSTPDAQRASYTASAAGKSSYTNAAVQQSAPIVQQTTYTAAAIPQSYTAHSGSSPAALQTYTATDAQKIIYGAPAASKSFTAPGKSYSTYQTAAHQAYTSNEAEKVTYSAPTAQKITFSAPVAQQSYTAPAKSHTTTLYQSVSSPAAQQAYTALGPVSQQSYAAPGQRISFNAPITQQQAYTAAGKAYNSYQSIDAPTAQKTTATYTAPIGQKSASYTAPIVEQAYTSPAKSYNTYQSYTSPLVQKTYSAASAAAASSAPFKAQAVETFSGPSHASVLASSGIDTKYASNGGYIY